MLFELLQRNDDDDIQVPFQEGVFEYLYQEDGTALIDSFNFNQ